MEKCEVTVNGERKEYVRFLRPGEIRTGPDPKFFDDRLRKERLKRHEYLECFRNQFSDSFLKNVKDITSRQTIRRSELANLNRKLFGLCMIDKELLFIEHRLNPAEICKEELARKHNAAEDSKKSHMKECVPNAKKPLRASSPYMALQRIDKRKILNKILLERRATNSNGVVLGPNGTTMSVYDLQHINWAGSDAIITRNMLVRVFDRKTLASHTLSGKPSPAFIGSNKVLKGQLDPAKVADILHFITTNFNIVPRNVRSAITNKCADERKNERQRQAKSANIQQKAEASNKN